MTRQTQITINGYVVGEIWQPGCGECYKPFSYDVAWEDRLLSEPGTLRDHVLRITNDGDFQHCRIADGYLEATIYKPNRSRSRIFDLSTFKSVLDCIMEDWEGPRLEEELTL